MGSPYHDRIIYRSGKVVLDSMKDMYSPMWFGLNAQTRQNYVIALGSPVRRDLPTSSSSDTQ